MKAVMQTVDGWPRGNCLMASLASILEVPLESLPDLYEEGARRSPADPESWWWGILLETCFAHGIHVEVMEPGDWRNPNGYPPGYAIASVRVPGQVPGHAVVALDGVIVHDPHPRLPSRYMTAKDVQHWYAITPRAAEAAA
jgi:hypothetical protein